MGASFPRPSRVAGLRGIKGGRFGVEKSVEEKEEGVESVERSFEESFLRAVWV